MQKVPNQDLLLCLANSEIDIQSDVRADLVRECIDKSECLALQSRFLRCQSAPAVT
jgi:hypothetical protein